MVVKGLPDDVEEEERIKNFIKNGNKPTKETISEDWTMISVRLPMKLLKMIDEKRGNQIGLSRNAWLLNLLQKSLKD